MFKKDQYYSRSEAVNMLRSIKSEPAQGAYFNIKNKNENITLAKIIFINYDSIYNDFLIARDKLNWSDSIGAKAKSGDDFLDGTKGIYVFFEAQKNPKRYYWVGKVKMYEKTRIGNKKIGIPNEFHLTFYEEVSDLVLKAFNNEKRLNQIYQLKYLSINNSYGATDAASALKISMIGETIFYKAIKQQKNPLIKKDVLLHLNDYKINKCVWINERMEKYKPYDFQINNEFYAIKTTQTNSKKFYVSKNELDFIKNNKLNVVIIHLDLDLNYQKHQLIKNDDLINSYNFSIQSTLVTPN